MITITEHTDHESLREVLQHPLPETHNVALWWLGQAGFAVKYGKMLLLIDPYLSDFLAKKYKGQEFPHIRMMPTPILPEEVRNVTLVLGTHRHSDHSDPETLPIVSQNNPQCVFVVPRAEQEAVIQLGIPEHRLRLLNAGESFSLAKDIMIEAIPAAHEELKVNAKGEHHYLGYILTLGEITIYHSGDCCPYAGLEDELKKRAIDLALLPMNGRDDYRRSRNILGNFTLTEAVDLCKQANIPMMIGHHFGMFDFNTVRVEEAERELDRLRGDKHYFLVKPGWKYLLTFRNSV